MLKLTFEITLVTGYHVGAGFEKGFNVDSALLRDAGDMPVLRGTGLTGLLRDGAYRLLELPPLAKYSAQEILERLFGSPAQIKRWRVSSTQTRPTGRMAKDAEAVHRVRIDPLSRRAEPRKLFSQEEGLAGQVFSFTMTCPKNDAAALDDAAFLAAAARNVRQLGRSRRRGLGECVIHLSDVHGAGVDKPADQSWEQWFLKRFTEVWMQGSPAEGTMPAVKSEIQSVNVSKGATVRLRVIVRLDEPLLVARRSAGNQFDTHPFIPGGAVLGFLAGQAAEKCDLAEPEVYSNFISLFLRGGVTFPVLYPAYFHENHLYPAIPAPLGLVTCSVVPFQDESEGHGAYPAWVYDKCPRCKNRLESIGDFMIIERDSSTFSPLRSSEMHVCIDKKTQRVVQGDLYGYTALRARQYFVGELLCSGEASWQRLREMTGIGEESPLTWWLGKARQRGYGQVTAWLERCDDYQQTWIRLPLQQRVSDPEQAITVTLLTDTIVSNLWGQQAAGFTEDWLEQTLGLGPLEVQNAFARTRVVDGFNATLGLPRWRITALVAGSTALITLEKPIKGWEERMEMLEAEGIGLRRSEGFGRLAFNHPVFEQCQNIRESAIPLDPQLWLNGRRGSDLVMKLWEEELDKNRSVLLKIKKQHGKRFNSCFGALARWLYLSGDHPLEEVIVQLLSMSDQEQGFGKPNEALVAAIGKQEYGERSKDNFFTKEGKDGIEAILKTLEYLKKEDPLHRRGGIRRLSEWIAGLVREEESAL
jgi:CRISPR-associated protein Csx10